MSTSNISDKDRRPETSKCSRSQMRRNIIQSQQQNRVKLKVNEIKPTQNVITLEQYFKGVNFKVVEIQEEQWDSELATQQNDINKFSLIETKNNNFRISRTNTKDGKRNKTNNKQQDQQSIGVQDYLSGRSDANQMQRQVGNSMGPNLNVTKIKNLSRFLITAKSISIKVRYRVAQQLTKTVKIETMEKLKIKYQFQNIQQMIATSKDFFGAGGGDMLRRTNYDKDKIYKMKQQVDQRFQKEEQELLNKYATKFNIFEEPTRQSYTLKEIYGKLK